MLWHIASISICLKARAALLSAVSLSELGSMSAIIQTHGLSKQYGPVHAVEGVDLRVERGEIYAFLGLNGAGKTTTIRALLGMIRPSAGSVSLFSVAASYICSLA